ncbi:hypothetical protein Tco_0153972 [Tanacetum coccineum]
MNWCGITASKAVLEYLALSYEAGDNSDRRSILRILFGPLQLVNKSFDSRKWISGYESLYRLSSLVINTQAHAPSFFVTMIKTVHPMANTGYNSHSPTSLVIDPLTPSIIRCHTIIGAFEIDETVYKEWEDRMERAATTASSLEAEQDSGNINRTQSMATLNESLP